MSSLVGALLIIAIVMFILMVIAISIGYLTHLLWLPAMLNKLAKRNLFITTVEEGTGKWILKSKEAWRFITSNPDTDPDNDWDVTKRKTREGLWNIKGREPSWVEWIDRNLPGGMRWVGILPRIYKIHKYNFRWSVLRESEPLLSEDGLVGRRQLRNGKWVASFAKTIDYIYLRDAVYYLELIGAQTKGCSDPNSQDKSVGMTVTIYMVATVRVVNPYLTLFKVHDWLNSNFALLVPSIRSWVSTVPFEDVVGKYEAAQQEHDIFLQTTGVPEEVAANSKEKPMTIVGYLEYAYGVRIKRLGFADVLPPEEYTLAVNRRVESYQNKIRIVVDAEAEEQRLTIVGRGEAARLTITAKAMADGGEDARLTRKWEAYEKMSEGGTVFVLDGDNDRKPQLLLNTPDSKTTKKGGGSK